MNLTIRKNGRYYQLGFYKDSKWNNILHLGTPAELLRKLGKTHQLGDVPIISPENKNKPAFVHTE
jgi:hypothetical protein